MRLELALFTLTSVAFGQTNIDNGAIFVSEDVPLARTDFTSTINTGVKANLRVLHGGTQEGSALLEVVTPTINVTLIPTRGLNVLRVADTGRNVIGGWNSGVNEVVNPNYLNQMDRAGSGFLAGFNEMVARCGYEYVGHAGEDGDEGLLTLHGKMANTPISYGRIYYNQTTKKVVIEGKAYERAFKKSYYTIDIVMEISTEKAELSFSDTLTNEGAYETEYMALYHSNFGPPILSAGSTLHIPAREVSPFNDAARSGLDEWDRLLAPTEGYDETVYNIFPYADTENMTVVGMVNADATTPRGIMMTYNITNLPALSLWKNLDLEKHGYVVGLEPGTSFSYNRKFQRDLNLVPKIQPDESITFNITYTFLNTADSIRDLETRVTNLLNSGGETSVISDPLSNEQEWTSDASVIIVNSSFFTGAVLSIILMSQ